MIPEKIHLNVSVYKKLRVEIYTVTDTENEQVYGRGSTVWKRKSLTINRKHTHACAFNS